MAPPGHDFHGLQKHIALLREHAQAIPQQRAELDEEDDDHYPRTRQRSKAADRRRRRETSDGFLSGSVKAIGGTGVMLAAAVLFNGIQIAERMFGSSMSSSQLIAREQQVADSHAPLARVDAEPSAAVQSEKPFVERRDAVPQAVAPAPPPPASEAAAPFAQPTNSIAGAKATQRAVTPVANYADRVALDGKSQRTKVQAPTKLAEAHALVAPKVAMAAPLPRPPATPVRPASKPAAASNAEEGDGLFVAVLSTHKEASAAQEEFAELQKKYARVLGSKQSEVQVISGQTGAWHRLVATPASTKAAANELCNDLRSVGYSRCWVKAY
jgi:SPOR domain